MPNYPKGGSPYDAFPHELVLWEVDSQDLISQDFGVENYPVDLLKRCRGGDTNA